MLPLPPKNTGEPRKKFQHTTIIKICDILRNVILENIPIERPLFRRFSLSSIQAESK